MTDTENVVDALSAGTNITILSDGTISAADGAATDLGIITSQTNVTITSSTGDNVLIPDADADDAGVMNITQYAKVQYLPIADPTYNSASTDDQYALVPNSLDGQPGTWALVSHTNSFAQLTEGNICLLYTSPSPRDRQKSRMPSSA